MPQKPHKPTKETRALVLSLAGYGAPQSYIHSELGLGSKMTLEKYYRKELDTGTARANAKMAQSLYQMGINGNVAAAIFWQKCRAGWKESMVIEGNADRPIIHKVERIIVDPAEK